LIGVGILGVGMAVIVPSVNSILGRLVSEEQRSHAISRAWMFGMTGFFVGPTVMGLISEYFGLRIAFYTIAILVAAVVPAILSLDRRAKAAGIKRA
ncbi:MAG: MFS transporter, partial [Paracoccaceae bacterium]|nr:MFS transporter [Paracoccaceae bacterium]